MPEVNEKALKAFNEVMQVIDLWEEGALTDEEMHQQIDLLLLSYRQTR